MCKCTPQDTKCTPSQSKSQFLGQFLLGGLDLEVYLHIFERSLRRRLKKGRQLFWQENVHPLRQNPGYAYGNDDMIQLGPLRCQSLFQTSVRPDQ